MCRGTCRTPILGRVSWSIVQQLNLHIYHQSIALQISDVVVVEIVGRLV